MKPPIQVIQQQRNVRYRQFKSKLAASRFVNLMLAHGIDAWYATPDMVGWRTNLRTI